jgi:hypothetical protein
VGESLAGYLLALDDLNGLPAGTTVWAVKRKAMGMPRLCVPSPYLRAPWLNLEDIAVISGGRPIEEIRGLTLAPVLEWLFGRSAITVGAPARFRLCPGCSRERRIELPALLEHSTGCAEHGSEYVSECRCREPIQPFMSQPAFACSGPGCTLRYDELQAPALTPSAREEQARVAALYRELVRFAPKGPRVDGLPHLGRALRLMVDLRRLGRAEFQSLRVRTRGRPGLRTVADVLLAAEAGPRDLARAIEDTRSIRKATIVAGRCPNPPCRATGLLLCKAEKQCRACGTRFNDDRILFSFDEQPGYSQWRAQANQRRLDEARERIRAICADLITRDVPIEREPVLRAASVPHNSVPHLSPRAGLARVITEAQTAQLEARLATVRADVARVSPTEPELRLRIELLGLAHALGVQAACKRLGVPRSRYYKWKTTHARRGLAGLRATCGAHA